MHTSRRLLIIAASLSALLLSATAARSQTAVTYKFLEVLDTEGKPVANAKVEIVPTVTPPKQTDERGQIREMPVYYGDYQTSGFKVSKPGYITGESTEMSDRNSYSDLFENAFPQYDEKAPVKVVLLKVPTTAAGRVAVKSEERRRELLRAVKAGDVATVEKLLRAGVSPDATDINGIPAILFAAANGDAATIKVLLAAGADVRNKERPGHKALLIYVRRARLKAIEIELVRSFVKAGADVNAADRYGATVLGSAMPSNNPELIKLLEEAGARSN